MAKFDWLPLISNYTQNILDISNTQLLSATIRPYMSLLAAKAKH